MLGFALYSGTGEELGRVVGLLTDADGRAKKLAFVEREGDEPRYVPLRFVRSISPGAVLLAGPREGYHITRVRDAGLGRVMPDLEGEPWEAS